MVPQILRHGLEILEQNREDPPVGLDHRVVGIGDVKIHGSVVGVDHDLHRIPDVVAELGDHLRIRVSVAGGVRVEDPSEPAFGDHQIGVVVEPQEGDDLAHALDDVAVHQHPAFVVDVLRKQNLQRFEPGRQKDFAHEGTDREPPLSLVVPVDVFLSLGVIEFLGVRIHEHMFVGQLAEIDLRPFHLQVHLRLRGNVLDEKNRQPLGGHLVDGAQRHAVTVGERQVLVDPGSVRQTAGKQFPRRQQGLLVFPINRVSVVVHRGELVIRPDLLDLAQGFQQRLLVPEPDVLDGGLVFPDVLGGQRLRPGQHIDLHRVQSVGPIGRGDGVLDIRGFLDKFVGIDDEFLQDLGIKIAQDVDDAHGHPRQDDFSKSFLEQVEQGEDRPDQGQARQNIPYGKLAVVIGKTDARDHPVALHEHFEPLDVKLSGQQEKKETHQQGKGAPALGSHDEPGGTEIHEPLEKENQPHPDGDHHQRFPQQRLDQLNHRQGKHVKGNVAAEDGIDFVERNRVEVFQNDIPLLRDHQARHDGQDQGTEKNQRPQVGCQKIQKGNLPTDLVGKKHGKFPGLAVYPAQGPVRQEKKQNPGGEPQPELSPQERPEHLHKTQAVEPQPIDVERDELIAKQRTDENDGHQNEQPFAQRGHELFLSADYCFHLIEQPIEGICSSRTGWPCRICSIASFRSRRVTFSGCSQLSSTRPRYCSFRSAP